MHRNICRLCNSWMVAHHSLLGWLSCSCGYAHEEKGSMSDKIYVTKAEILMGREKEYPLTPELEANLDKLFIAVNKLRHAYGKPLIVSSGYRPGRYNTAAGGAKNSSHLTCQAVDFSDPKGELDKWLTENVKVLEDCGLFLEDPEKTPSWTHVQTRPTKNRIFKI